MCVVCHVRIRNAVLKTDLKPLTNRYNCHRALNSILAICQASSACTNKTIQHRSGQDSKQSQYIIFKANGGNAPNVVDSIEWDNGR